MKYKKHIFVCTNQKEESKKCCGEAHGLNLVEKFREEVIKCGLSPLDIRVQRSGCLGVCSLGPALVVYPDADFYGNVQEKDISRILDTYISGKEQSQLKLNFDK